MNPDPESPQPIPLAAPLGHRTEREYTTLFFILIAASLVLRLIIAAAKLAPLQADEAYYWDWSRHPDWSYYSKGPMVAYLIHLGTLLGGHNAFFVRLPSIVGAMTTATVIFFLARALFGSARLALWTAIAFASTPLLTVGTMLITIDNPLFLFWSACLLCTWQGYSTGRPGWWIGVGLAFGLGIMSKAVIIFYIPSLVFFLWFAPGGRAILKSPRPWLALALGFLFFAPQVYWNGQHNWPMFRDFAHKGGGGGAFAFKPGYFFRMIGSQIGVLLPLGFTLVLWGLREGWRRGFKRREPEHLFLFCMAAPVLGFYTLLSLRAKIGGNWLAIGYLTPMLAGVNAWRAWADSPSAKPGMRRLANGGLFFGLVLCHAAIMLPVGTLSRLGFHAKLDPTLRLYGWDHLAEGVQPILDQYKAEEPFIAGINYQVCAELAFYLPGNPHTVCLTKRGPSNQYFYWNDFAPLVGKSAIIVAENEKKDYDRFAHAFTQIELVKKLELRHTPDGDVLKTYYIWHGTDFKGWKFK